MSRVSSMEFRLSSLDPPAQTSGVGIWRWHHWAAVTGLLLFAFSVGWWTRAPEVGVGGDEATYILLSQSIEHGRYHDEFLAGTPPHTKYPPGNPVWIMLIRQVAGPNVEALRAANLILLMLTGLILGDGVRRVAGAWAGVAGVGLTALNPVLLSLSGTGLSEALYTFLVTFAVWLALIADDGGRRLWAFLSSTVAVASFLTRLMGLTAIGGVGIWLLVRRRWRDLALHTAASVGVVAAWFYYSTWHRPEALGVTYANDLELLPRAGEGGLNAFAQHAASLAGEYLTILPGVFGVPTIPDTPVDNLIWVALLGAAGLLGFASLSRRWPAILAYLGLSVGLLLTWPWPVERLLAPLVPAIAALVLCGGPLAAKLSARRSAMALPLLIASVLCVSGLLDYIRNDRRHGCDRDDPYADPKCFNPQVRGLVTAVRLSQDSLPPGSIVATSKPAPVYYFGGHRTVPITTLLGRVQATGNLDLKSSGADVVLVSGFRDWTSVTTVLVPHCRELSIRIGIEPTTLLLGPLDQSHPGEDACRALKDFESYVARDQQE